MDVERLITRAIAGFIVLMVSGYLFRTSMTQRLQARHARLEAPPRDSVIIEEPAQAPSSDQIAGGMVPPEIGALLDYVPPDVLSAAKKAPYLLNQYKEAMRELADAIGGSEAAYRAMLNGDYGKLGGAYAERVKQDALDKTVFNPGGPCGDYPQKWCKMAPNSVVSFGGGSHLNRRSACYVSWKLWSLGRKTASGGAGNRPGSSLTPAVGSAAVWNSGPARRYGHIAYVTAVNAGSITVGEFDHRPYVYTSRTIKRGSSGWPDRFMP